MQILDTNQINHLKALLLSSESNNWLLAIEMLKGLQQVYTFPIPFLSFLRGISFYKNDNSQAKHIHTLRKYLDQLSLEVNPDFDQQVKALMRKISSIEYECKNKHQISYPKILTMLKDSPLDLASFGEAMAAQSIRYNFSLDWRGRFLLEQQCFSQQQFEKTFLKNYYSIPKAYLLLYRLGITTVPNTYLENLTHIKHVQIADNFITALPTVLYQFPLETLAIHENPIKTIAPACKNWQALEKLELYKCRELEYLPKELGSLKNLKKLELSHCRLHQFPRPILELKNLEFLTLSQNKLTQLPKELVQLKKLKRLSLHQNLPLQQFPNTILKMPWLTDLRMNECNLKTLPEEIGQLEQLENLTLAYNKLKTLPQSLTQLKNLEYLKLSGNPLDLVATFDLVLSLPKIRSVELSNIFSCTQQEYKAYALEFKKRNISLYVDYEKLPV